MSVAALAMAQPASAEAPGAAVWIADDAACTPLNQAGDLDAGAEELFSRLDANRDGTVTQREYVEKCTPPEAGAQRSAFLRSQAAERFQAFSADDDGKLSLEEYAGTIERAGVDLAERTGQPGM